MKGKTLVKVSSAMQLEAKVSAATAEQGALAAKRKELALQVRRMSDMAEKVRGPHARVAQQKAVF